MTEQAKGGLTGRRGILLTMGAFLAPLLIATLMYTVIDWKPGGKTNYGELVHPARPLELAEIKNHEGETLKKEYWKKWTFVMIDANGCEEACFKNLYHMRQVRASLAKNIQRVQNMLILNDKMPTSVLQENLKNYPRFTYIYPDAEGVQDLVKQFKLEGKPEPGAEPRMYLIDPFGNLMMTYTPDSEPKKILEDLRKLLKLSRIG